MHKPEPVLENKTQKILLKFERQTDPWIPDKKSDQGLINK